MKKTTIEFVIYLAHLFGIRILAYLLSVCSSSLMPAHENSRTLLKLFVMTVHTNKYFIDRHLVRFARFGFFSKLHKSFLDFRFKVEIISYAKF